jgi:hypothetical protein
MNGNPKKLNARVVRLGDRREARLHGSTCVGTVTAWSAEGGLLVDYDGNPHGPLSARTTLVLAEDEVEELIAARHGVVLAFDRDDSTRPIVIGVVRPVPSAKASVPTRKENRGAPVRAVVDGREVVLEGETKVELRCGKASIVLTKAGKVIIQGTYISSRSSGAYRIRGGSVEVN